MHPEVVVVPQINGWQFLLPLPTPPTSPNDLHDTILIVILLRLCATKYKPLPPAEEEQSLVSCHTRIATVIYSGRPGQSSHQDQEDDDSDNVVGETHSNILCTKYRLSYFAWQQIASYDEEDSSPTREGVLSEAFDYFLTSQSTSCVRYHRMWILFHKSSFCVLYSTTPTTNVSISGVIQCFGVIWYSWQILPTNWLSCAVLGLPPPIFLLL